MLHKNHVLQDEIAMLRLEIDTIKNQKQKVVGYKCKFCVEVHPTLRAICNHLRKHVQYGSVPAVSAAVKVRRGKVWMSILVCERFALLINPVAPSRSGRGVLECGHS